MANTTGVAPICNTKSPPPDFTTKPPAIPRFSIPSINNPQSVVAAILQLQQAVNALANATAPPNNTTPGVPVGPGTNPGGAAPGFGGGGKQIPQPAGDWVESGRVTENVKVVNPDDDSQFVIVKEIVSITFERPSTGEMITITRDAG